jgi:hypothetical protein
MKLRLRTPTISDFQLPLFVVALAAGTVWLIGPVSSKPAPPVMPADTADLPALRPAYPPPTFSPERFATPTYPLQAQQRDAAQKATAKADPEKLREELIEAEQAARERLAQLEASNADLQAVQTQIDALRNEIAALEAKRASLGPVDPATLDTAEVDKLAALVDTRREEVGTLKAELQRIKLPENLPRDEVSKLSGAASPQNKLPIPVELIHDQIAPVTKEFFKFPSTTKAEYIVTRIRRGETIEEASQPDSAFATFLTKVHPKKQYLLLLVNPDSFDSFYAVREMALRAGLEISWQPLNTSDGTIPIVHVVPASAKHPGWIRLPDVVK